MSYNGSGTFTINTTGQPVVAGTIISSTAFNSLTSDLATGLTTAITKDGQTTTTARITFAQGFTSSLTTDSSSISTGSIITAGGAGIAKNVYVGGNANVAGTLDVTGGITTTNPVINNIKMGYTTTATAAGTTTLTVSSNYRQFFTGTTTQTIVLPVTSTLVTGIAYEIENNSTGLLTVNSSGGNLVGTIPAGVCAHAVCIGTTLTTAADWDWDYISTSTITGTGANVLGTSPTITSPTLVTPALGTPASGVMTNVTGINYDGYKNRIINGLMTIDQRNAAASQTFTAGGALAYSVDRWYGYCTGANVTGQQVAGSTTPTNTQFRYRFTGAASVTAVGFGQRIEQKNSYDLAGSTATLSADLAISATLTTVTWTAYYATTTADTFGSLASPTVTQIATGTFTVTSTVTNFSTNITIPAAATTGIQIVFTVGALTAGLTWTIGNVQLEKGATATSFDYRPYGTELALCQRYFEKSYNTDVALGTVTNTGMASWQATSASTSVNQRCMAYFRVTKRTTASGATYSPNSGTIAKLYNTRAASDDDTVIQTIGSNSLQIQDQSASVLINDTLSFHWTASSEL